MIGNEDAASYQLFPALSCGDFPLQNYKWGTTQEKLITVSHPINTHTHRHRHRHTLSKINTGNYSGASAEASIRTNCKSDGKKEILRIALSIVPDSNRVKVLAMVYQCGQQT